MARRDHGGRTVRAEWPGSWNKQKVTASEWKSLRKGLRLSYEKAKDALDSAKSLDPDEMAAGISIIVHTAYHLSAIRQLVKNARSPNDSFPTEGCEEWC